ncbi:MAG: suhB [Mycobacterium sp.]|jgi:myo-inositol-1(or 4)-monophosphatase|nr:suhB [Mycobacterium sp.]
MAAPDPADLLTLALAVADEAGALAVAARERDLDVDTKSSATDVVTAADRAVEELITTRLLDARPDDGVLGEEGADSSGTSGVRWVVDPIDGTVNYLYRLPGWAVSIAAEVDGRIVAGVVHQATTGTTYSAVLGGGALRRAADGTLTELTGSAVDELPQALVATGFGYVVERRTVQAQLVAQILPRIRDIRRFGAASLDLCWSATGQVDAFYERGLNPWDLAAGGLIAAEAGLRVEGLAGAPAGYDLTIAAPPALFGPLHDLLAGTGLALLDAPPA